MVEDVPENPMSPSAVLSTLMKEKNVTLESIKEKLVEEKYDKAAEISSINDIPKPKMFELIDRLKKLKKKKD